MTKWEKTNAKTPECPQLGIPPGALFFPTPGPYFPWLPGQGKDESALVEPGHKQDVPCLLCEGTVSSEPRALALSSCVALSAFADAEEQQSRQPQPRLVRPRDQDLLLVHRLPLCRGVPCLRRLLGSCLAKCKHKIQRQVEATRQTDPSSASTRLVQ